MKEKEKIYIYIYSSQKELRNKNGREIFFLSATTNFSQTKHATYMQYAYRDSIVSVAVHQGDTECSMSDVFRA